jgi:hypothetical protein
MQLLTFTEWLRHRPAKPVEVPEATRALQIIAAAGPGGVTRHQLRGAIRLPPKVLDQLLAALLQAGQISLSWQGDGYVFRSPPWLAPDAGDFDYPQQP